GTGPKAHLEWARSPAGPAPRPYNRPESRGRRSRRGTRPPVLALVCSPEISGRRWLEDGIPRPCEVGRSHEPGDVLRKNYRRQALLARRPSEAARAGWAVSRPRQETGTVATEHRQSQPHRLARQVRQGLETGGHDRSPLRVPPRIRLPTRRARRVRVSTAERRPEGLGLAPDRGAPRARPAALSAGGSLRSGAEGQGCGSNCRR